MTSDLIPTSLGCLCSFSAGDAFGKELQGRDSGDYPFIKVSDMNEIANQLYIRTANNWISSDEVEKRRIKLHPPQAIVFAKIGIALTYNRRRILGGPTAIDNNMMAAVPNEEVVDPRYLYYLLSTLDFNNIAQGSALPYLTQTALNALAVNIHHRDIQPFVAKVLGDLDDKIDLLREINRTQEDIARAVFRAWFVDFEPVRAKAAGATSFRGMSQALFNTLPDSFEQSESGAIPKGWKVHPLSAIVEHPRRAANPNNIDGSTPYIGLEHMPRRSITLSEWETAEKVSSNKHSFKRFELLFGKLRPNFHKVGIAFVDGVCSTDIVVLRPRAQEYFGIALGFLSSDDFVAHNVAATSGTKMPRTSWEIMARYEVALPGLTSPLINEFDLLNRSIAERLKANVHEGRTLAGLRDALLPKLISGEIAAPSLEALGLKAVGNGE